MGVTVSELLTINRDHHACITDIIYLQYWRVRGLEAIRHLWRLGLETIRHLQRFEG